MRAKDVRIKIITGNDESELEDKFEAWVQFLESETETYQIDNIQFTTSVQHDMIKFHMNVQYSEII